MNLTVKTVPPLTLLQWCGTTTLPEIPKVAGPAIDSVIHAARDAGLVVSGPCTFLYRNGIADFNGRFDLTIGVEVVGAAQDIGPLRVRRTDPFRCGCLIYPGSMAGIHEGYAAASRQMKALGLRRAAEFREVYLHWVDFDSPENRTEIQLGIV